MEALTRIRPTLLLLLLTGLVLAGYCAYRIGIDHPTESRPYMQDGRVNFTVAADFWGGRIEAVGMDRAYEEMAVVAETLDASSAHELAHGFGEALFRAVGTSGVVVCDDRFVYGCYHQLIGDTVARDGLTAVQTFKTFCAGKNGAAGSSCEHGLGHGILGFLGYDATKLSEALGLCGENVQSDRTRGCHVGVFMEYNMHELAAYESGVIEPRPFSVGIRYSPCDSIDAKYTKSCVRELPNWWVATMHATGTTEDRFELAGTYCRGMAGSSRERCFEGIGHIATPIAALRQSEVRGLCDAAAQGDDRRSCLFSAIRRFRIEGYSGYPALCETFGFSGADGRDCRDYAETSGF